MRKYIESISTWAAVSIIAAMLFLSVFFCSAYFTDYYILPKWYAFIFGAILLQLFIITKKNESIQVDLISLLVFTLLGYIFIHALIFDFYIIGLLTVVSLLSLYLTFKSILHFRAVIDYVIITIVISLSIYTILQFFGICSINSLQWISGSYDNPSGLAMSIAMGSPFIISHVFYSNKLHKILGFIGTSLVIYAVVLSESRTGLLAILIVLLVSVLNQYKYFINKNKIAITLCLSTSLIAVFILFFFYKKNSSVGRLFIWDNTIKLIERSPIIGLGMDSFRAEYMPVQADFFSTHPNHQYVYLADYVSHPFNEYLLITSEYGLIGLIMLLLLFCISIYSIRKSVCTYNLSIIALMICALFSYPFRYPFVCAVSIYSLAILSTNMHKISLVSHFVYNIYLKTGFFICFVFSLALFCDELNKELTWQKTSKRSLQSEIEETKSMYYDLYIRFNNKSAFFLYNYGATLNQISCYGESLNIMTECKKLYNDYNVQILIADNYYKLGDLNKSEEHYKFALNMCPNRFLPLDKLLSIYIMKNNLNKARKTASIIIEKKIKIPSLSISMIKDNAEKYLYDNE